MEIRSSTTVVPTGTAGVRPQRRSATEADEGAASFTNTQALHDALAAEPEVRSDQVDRVRQALSESGEEYPSAAVLKKVSNLIADRIASSDDESGAS